MNPNLTGVSKPTQWKPGQSGNLNGRPVGTRQAFSAGFLRDLAEVWQEHGRDTMVHTQPATRGIQRLSFNSAGTRVVTTTAFENIAQVWTSDLSTLTSALRGHSGLSLRHAYLSLG